MSFIIIIGALFAWWVYRDAKKWGYGQKMAMLWACGTIVFPYVIVPLYFVLGRKFQIKPRQQSDFDLQTIEGEAVFVGDMVDCPMCASKVQDNFANCPRCGYSLKRICAKCGRELERDWKVCPHCQEPAPEK